MRSKELFGDLVSDVLKHLYDPAYLETHELADLLFGGNVPEETKGVSLRKVLIEAVEQLKPGAEVSYNHAGWLPYRVLRQHYVEALDQHRVCDEIGLGRTSFYKYQRIGLEALTEIFWKRYAEIERSADQPAKGAENGPARAAARLASRSQRQRVDVARLLESIQNTLQPLAQIEGISLNVPVPGDSLVTQGDPAMLRQLFISILSGAMPFADDELSLAVTPFKERLVFRLTGLDGRTDSEAALRDTEGFLLAHDVVEVYGGELSFLRDAQGALALSFTLPKAAATNILFIDDDVETLALYRRYVQEQGYVVILARSGQEMRTRLREIKPDIILLDVLMPQEDGWSLLQELRVLPKTADTPIVVCSVLSQPRLALALGAVEVLQKPVEPATLLQTLEKWLQ